MKCVLKVDSESINLKSNIYDKALMQKAKHYVTTNVFVKLTNRSHSMLMKLDNNLLNIFHSLDNLEIERFSF